MPRIPVADVLLIKQPRYTYGICIDGVFRTYYKTTWPAINKRTIATEFAQYCHDFLSPLCEPGKKVVISVVDEEFNAETFTVSSVTLVEYRSDKIVPDDPAMIAKLNVLDKTLEKLKENTDASGGNTANNDSAANDSIDDSRERDEQSGG